MADGDYLRGKIAIVTGASRGIGAAIAERIAAVGAEVICAARTVDGDPARGTANATVERIRARGGKAHAMKLDMTDAASREALIRGVVERFGRIDILVNNAGTAVYKSTEEMPLADVEAQTQTYFIGPWHLCHLVLPQMKKQGEGRILQIGSCVIFPRPSRSTPIWRDAATRCSTAPSRPASTASRSASPPSCTARISR
jgi:NAD(P)-dependent dehydrogenase (short-subunit alcohol dehydrogenase family)